MLSPEKTNSKKTIDERVEILLGKLTLSEKIALLSGRDLWRTVPVERLGIPSIVMTDGPHGVRSDGAGDRPLGSATSFPTGVSMASTWDTELIERVGTALAEEARAMDCDILLGPCVNIARVPLAGRNFESYSEDPYLAGRIAVAWIKGLQAQRVGASLKHYACNNQETERYRGNSIVDERTLREIYLPAFETAVKETQPWTVMHSYNRINGTYAAENHYLLSEILREEWGFEGAVISDWTATHSTVPPVKAGLDLEMPGPAKWFGGLLEHAVATWQVDESVIDAAARRVLRLVVLSGRMDDPGLTPPGSVNTPQHQALAREVAEESIVLLKNDRSLLPLDKSKLKSLAVIGPNAAVAIIGGGGSSYLEPPYRISPLEGLKAKLGKAVKVEYEPGCSNLVGPVPLDAGLFVPASGKGHGLTAEFFATPDFSGKPAARSIEPGLNFLWIDRGPAKNISAFVYSARFSGKLVVPETGSYQLVLGNSECCKVYLDGRLLMDNHPRTMSLTETWSNPESMIQRVQIDLEAGRAYDFRAEYVKNSAMNFGVVQLLYSAPISSESIERAASLAARCDAAVIFAGMPTGFESEGGDRPDMDLPGPQTALIEAVVHANPRTVVVVNAGSPVSMPWLEQVPAVLEAFYPGQEGGSAVANILFGDVTPSGKLTVTFPKRIQDTPAFINFPGTMEVFYGEGIFIGYRYYDKKDVEPLFPFGFGLSYTTFEYSDLKLPKSVAQGKPVKVSVRVKNSGALFGKEVVQLYVGDPISRLVRPPQELKGFKKISLLPGESQVVEFELDQRALSFYDPYLKQWVAEPGEFEIRVGSSSRDIRLKGSFTLK